MDREWDLFSSGSHTRSRIPTCCCNLVVSQLACALESLCEILDRFPSSQTTSQPQDLKSCAIESRILALKLLEKLVLWMIPSCDWESLVKWSAGSYFRSHRDMVPNCSWWPVSRSHALEGSWWLEEDSSELFLIRTLAEISSVWYCDLP